MTMDSLCDKLTARQTYQMTELGAVKIYDDDNADGLGCSWTNAHAGV